jgi:ABC-2 type transport system ATP-binding protein
MAENIVSIKHLSHRYGTDWAVQDISFDISRNGVVGLLGSNGAGKSTTMNILCGVLNQTEGDVFINETNLRKEPEKAKKMIGFLPQVAPLYMDLTVNEYLVHCAHLRLMETKSIPDALAAAKEKCGIARFSHRLIKNLSGGYRQRVGIAQAIIHSPRLVVLDEPTNGLDPVQIYEVRKLIKEIGQDRAVLFSTHILSEIQATCNEVKMIEGGHVVFSDTMEAFNNYIKPGTLLVTLESPPAIETLAEIAGITRAEVLDGKKFRLHFIDDALIGETIVRMSVEYNWRLREILFERSSLDEIFAQLSKKN